MVLIMFIVDYKLVAFVGYMYNQSSPVNYDMLVVFLGVTSNALLTALMEYVILCQTKMPNTAPRIRKKKYWGIYRDSQ